MVVNRYDGPVYAIVYWLLIACNIVIPQMHVVQEGADDSVVDLFVISLIVNVGMWLERFVIVVISLHRDFLPSSWGMYYPTRWDWATYVGTIGLFLTLLYLFIRFLPVISIFEMRSLVEEDGREAIAGFSRRTGEENAMAQIFHHSTNTDLAGEHLWRCVHSGAAGWRAVRD